MQAAAGKWVGGRSLRSRGGAAPRAHPCSPTGLGAMQVTHKAAGRRQRPAPARQPSWRPGRGGRRPRSNPRPGGSLRCALEAVTGRMRSLPLTWSP